MVAEAEYVDCNVFSPRVSVMLTRHSKLEMIPTSSTRRGGPLSSYAYDTQFPVVVVLQFCMNETPLLLKC